ncbi:MAG: helix-hairpin-helix domain-containing protein [Thermodesulfobacteriota bacterium]
MNSATATAADRDRRTLVLLGLALVIWLGSAARSHVTISPQPFPSAGRPPEFLRAGEGTAPEPAAKETTDRNPASLALVSFQPIPINRADREALIALDGVGPVLAGRIIEWRGAHGRFRNSDDLLAVRGIGPKKLAKILPQITFD